MRCDECDRQAPVQLSSARRSERGMLAYEYVKSLHEDIESLEYVSSRMQGAGLPEEISMQYLTEDCRTLV
jgi:hypothetical protein